MKTPEDQIAEYEAKCTHRRDGHRVYNIDGKIEFDGSKVHGSKDILGINAAKRHVRINNLVSYNI